MKNAKSSFVYGFLSLATCVHALLSREDVTAQTLPAYTLASNADVLDGTTCREELEDFKSAVDRRILWSLRMLDSSGEPKTGFVYGNNYWLGSRSQCLDTTNRRPLEIAVAEQLNNSIYRDAREEFPPFDLNYFVAHFRHNSTLQYHVRLPDEDLITLGLCMPASCTTLELEKVLKKMFSDRTLLIGDLYSADFELVEVRNLINDRVWFFNARIIFISLILIMSCAITLIGTAYDVLLNRKRSRIRRKYLKSDDGSTGILNGVKNTSDNTEAAMLTPRRESKLGKILTCFSIPRNTKIIFDTKISGESIPDVHGLRFLGMVWIIMIHTIYYMANYADNKPWSWRMAEGFTVQIVSNSTLAVDTFFFLSGFLISYMYLKKKIGKEEKKPINYAAKVNEFFLAVLKRFIRITPAYMMMIGIAELNFGWYDKTSQFYMTERPQEVCAKYWWRNILYINNLFGRENMCLSWSWYLSNDMQFFTIAIFLLILSSISFSTAVTIMSALLTSSIVVTGYLSYVNKYVPTLDAQYHYLDIIYDPPWTRIGPYIVGMMTAYVIIKLNNELHLKKRTLVLCWCFGSSCNILVLFGLWKRYISVLAAAFYVALCRTVWAIGIAWILIACNTKHGGVVHQILAFRGWVPLSRLTFCAYLLNPFLINSVYLHNESAVHVDFLPNGTMFLGFLVMSYFCAYILSLLFETPYVLLMRLLVDSKNRSE